MILIIPDSSGMWPIYWDPFKGKIAGGEVWGIHRNQCPPGTWIYCGNSGIGAFGIPYHPLISFIIQQPCGYALVTAECNLPVTYFHVNGSRIFVIWWLSSSVSKCLLILQTIICNLICLLLCKIGLHSHTGRTTYDTFKRWCCLGDDDNIKQA